MRPISSRETARTRACTKCCGSVCGHRFPTPGQLAGLIRSTGDARL
jgi:hypothetical protein